MADVMSRIRAGYALKDASCVPMLQNTTVPMLFIHGDKDSFVPFYMLEQNYQAYTINCSWSRSCTIIFVRTGKILGYSISVFEEVSRIIFCKVCWKKELKFLDKIFIILKT